MDDKKYKVIPFSKTTPKEKPESPWDVNFQEVENRYAITDLNDRVIDDANGYGYKSMQSAHKAASYKFNGGKQKQNKTKTEAKVFMKKYPSVLERMESEMFYSLKDGEPFGSAEFWKRVEEENNIQIPLPVRKYMEKY